MRVAVRLRFVSLVALLLPSIPGIATATARHQAALACTGSWQVEPSPNVTQGENELVGVSAVSSADVWAVGSKQPDSGPKPLTHHWDGTAWSVVPTPFVGDAVLTGVSAISSSDVWAAGYRESAIQTPLAYHWDGTAWKLVRTPQPGIESQFLGISAASGSDVWAVGHVFRAGLEQSLAMHWDGSTWAVVPTPSPPSRNVDILGVTAIADDDAWAVGNAYDSHSFAAAPIAMHWDGTLWALVPLPHVDGEYLAGVFGTSTSDVWAVGTIGIYPTTSLMLHWDGSAWSDVPSPSPGTSGNELQSVTADSANRAWAVGWSWSLGGLDVPLIVEWDGSTWSVAPSPVPNPNNENLLMGVSAVSSSEAWTVGGFVDPARQDAYSTLTMHEC